MRKWVIPRIPDRFALAQAVFNRKGILQGVFITLPIVDEDKPGEGVVNLTVLLVGRKRDDGMSGFYGKGTVIEPNGNLAVIESPVIGWFSWEEGTGVIEEFEDALPLRFVDMVL